MRKILYQIVLVSAVLSLQILIIFTAGCKKKQSLDDYTVHCLQKTVIDNPKCSNETKKIAKKIIELWENEEIDDKPVVLEVFLTAFEGDEDIYLTFTYYDENRDLLGIIIEEKNQAGETIINEKYPIFVHESFSYIVDTGGPKVTFRVNDERKDEDLWKRFVSSDSSVSPQVFLSLPSEKIEVFLSLYDRQGNQSNEIKVSGPKR